MKTKESNAKAIANEHVKYQLNPEFKKSFQDCGNMEMITDEDLAVYIDCLYKGWGYIPTKREDFEVIPSGEMNDEQAAMWKELNQNGDMYKICVKEAFLGLVAIRALGGTFEKVEPDFSFIEQSGK